MPAETSMSYVKYTPLSPDSEDMKSCSSSRDFEDADDSNMPIQRTYRLTHKKGFWFHLYMTLLHIALFAACWTLLKPRGNSSISSSRLGSYTPAFEAVHEEIIENKVTSHSGEGIYAGTPSEETNRAWESLILPTYFKISKEQLIAAGETVDDTIQLESGDYVAVTGVYHELHCLRQIRFYIYKDTYYPNITQLQDDYLRVHVNHCVEVLRKEIMCTGDVSIHTFFWHDPPSSKPGVKTKSKKICINWERFEKWSLDHMVPIDAAVKGGPNPTWSKWGKGTIEGR